MGRAVRCPECGKVLDNREELEDLRDNDSVCLVCNAPIEVADWDRVLASYDEDEDLDDLDEDNVDERFDEDFGWDEEMEDEEDFIPVDEAGAKEASPGEEDKEDFIPVDEADAQKASARDEDEEDKEDLVG